MEKKIIKLEQKARRRILQNLILKSVAAAGVISVGLVAPGVLGAMKKLGFLSYKRQGEAIRTSRNNLIKKKYIEFDTKGLRLTEKGREYLLPT